MSIMGYTDGSQLSPLWSLQLCTRSCSRAEGRAGEREMPKPPYQCSCPRPFLFAQFFLSFFPSFSLSLPPCFPGLRPKYRQQGMTVHCGGWRVRASIISCDGTARDAHTGRKAVRDTTNGGTRHICVSSCPPRTHPIHPPLRPHLTIIPSNHTCLVFVCCEYILLRTANFFLSPSMCDRSYFVLLVNT